MKKLLLFVVVIAIIVGGGIAAGNHYKNYQNKKAQEAAAADEAAENARIQPFRDRIAELKGQYNSQVTECQKGAEVYDKLSQAVKNQTPQPVCGTPIE